jgi:hypothetical protein
MQIAISPSRLREHQSGFPQIGHGCLCEARTSAGSLRVRISGGLSFVELPSEVIALTTQGIVRPCQQCVEFFKPPGVLEAARTDAATLEGRWRAAFL